MDIVSNKIEESGCSILCLQETKRESFDAPYIRNFCPKRINKFEFTPSVGASGGLLIAWNDSYFQGQKVFENKFSLSIQFTSVYTEETWFLTNIYGPCLAEEKLEFLNWLNNIQTPDDVNWLMLVDFNYVRYPENRNKDGANFQEMV